MSYLFYAAAMLLVVTLLGLAFVRSNPASLAAGLRTAGPIVLGLAGAGLLLTGRAGIGGMLLSGAFAWYTANRVARGKTKTPGRRSTVRTAALEMELDHDTGGLDGMVLAGRHEGRRVSEMTLDELLALHADLASDGESLQLLETYLDGRFPAWRENADADARERQRGAPGSGAMTEQEAYQVLGLEAGASAADVRKAHRRLMQRVHPDLGGSSFLAARINQAKDVLLAKHD
jgi:hypothetical protein